MDLRSRPVAGIMSREIVALSPNDTLDHGQDLMSLGRVRHIPVVDGEHLVGVLSHRDLLAASLTRALDFDKGSRRSFLRSVKIDEVMTRDVVTIGPDTTLGDAASILVGRQIGCLPVLSADGTLVGLVTETDLIAAAFVRAEGDETNERTIDVSKPKMFSEWLEDEVNDLRRVRDELRVQAALGKAELRDRFDALERGYESLEQRAKRASRAAEEPLQSLEDDVRKLARDLREGYRRIRDAL